jgi:hypothetical protein
MTIGLLSYPVIHRNGARHGASQARSEIRIMNPICPLESSSMALTSEPAHFSHQAGDHNTGKDARQRHGPFTQLICPANDGRRADIQASITQNPFLSFAISLNEVINRSSTF